jgi:branched-chain amino acid aminotransferase
MGKVFINGRVHDKYDATISVYDHGLLFGDGVTCGVRIARGQPLLLTETLQHLETAAKAIYLKLPLDQAGFAATIEQLLQLDHRQVGYVKIVVTRGPGMLAHDPRKCVPAIIMICDDVMPYPLIVADEGLHIITAKTVRHASDIAMSLSSQHLVQAKLEALEAGCLDALILNMDGHVTGALDANLFAVLNGEIITPDTTLTPDPVFAEWITAELAKLGHPVTRRKLTRDALTVCSELFLAGTITGIVPITRLDETVYSQGQPGPITQKLREALLQYRDDSNSLGNDVEAG